MELPHWLPGLQLHTQMVGLLSLHNCVSPKLNTSLSLSLCIVLILLLRRTLTKTWEESRVAFFLFEVRQQNA